MRTYIISEKCILKTIQLERVVSFRNLAIYITRPNIYVGYILLALYNVFPECHNPCRDHLADTGRKHCTGKDLISSVRKSVPIKYQIIFSFGLRKKM